MIGVWRNQLLEMEHDGRHVREREVAVSRHRRSGQADLDARGECLARRAAFQETRSEVARPVDRSIVVPRHLLAVALAVGPVAVGAVLFVQELPTFG